MKKFVKILSLSLALIMSVMMFASCGLFGPKPADDPNEAYEALKDANYEAQLITNDGDDSLLGGLIGSASMATYKGLFEIGDDVKVDAIVVASDSSDQLHIFYFADEDDAKDFADAREESLKDDIEDLEAKEDDMTPNDYEKAMEKLENTIIGRKGEMVWIANSKDIIKAAK